MEGLGFHPGVTRAVGEAFGPVACYEGFWLVWKAAEGFEGVDLSGAEFFVPPHLEGLIEI